MANELMPWKSAGKPMVAVAKSGIYTIISVIFLLFIGWKTMAFGALLGSAGATMTIVNGLIKRD